MHAFKRQVGLILLAAVFSVCSGLACSAPHPADNPPGHPVNQTVTAHHVNPSVNGLIHPWKSRTALKSSAGALLWQKRLNGYPSDLALDGTGHELIVATIPSPDRAGGSHKNQLFWLEAGGKVRWRKEPAAQLRAVSMAADGSLAVVSDYEDQLLAYDKRGKLRWQVRATCVPFALSQLGRVVCYHDDDAEPGVAFDVFDWNGKKLASRPAATDIIAFKISADERNIAVGLVGGVVNLYRGDDFSPRAKFQVRGEVADLAPSSGEHPRVAILFHERAPAARLPTVALVEDADPQPAVAELKLKVPAEQIAIAADGRAADAYGNSDEGQYLTAIDFRAPEAPAARWAYGIATGGRYNQAAIAASGGEVLAAFEDDAEGKRLSRIAAFDPAGDLAETLSVAADEGAYLYGTAFSQASRVLAVTTDDGRVAAYRLSPLASNRSADSP